MKSGTTLAAPRYAQYIPGTSLQDYGDRVNKPNGTDPRQACGPERGSFLACYLQDTVINLPEKDAIKKLDDDASIIDDLKRKHQCEIIFDDVQLQAIFKVLKTKINLYYALIAEDFLMIDAQCKNGNQFLHYYLSELDLNDKAALETARHLIEHNRSEAQSEDQLGLCVRGEAGYPLAILLKKITQTLGAENQPVLTHRDAVFSLLKDCQLEKVHKLLSREEESTLLQYCFALLSGSCLSVAAAGLGFEAVMAAASVGMPLSQPLKAYLDGKTSLFAHILELDTTCHWGVENLRRLMQWADERVVNLGVKANTEAVTLERLSQTYPEDIASYRYDPGLSQGDRDPQAVCYSNDFVMSLDVASEFYLVSSIVRAWRSEITIPLINPHREDSFVSVDSTNVIPLCYVSEKYLPRKNKYREMVNDKYGRKIPKYELCFSKKSSGKPELLTRETYTGFGSHGVQEIWSKAPSELKSILAADKTGKNFADKIVAAYNDKHHKRVARFYVHPHHLVYSPRVESNALLVYLAKGGDVLDARTFSYDVNLNPLQFYIMYRNFTHQTSVVPALVSLKPGQIPMTSIFKHGATGEFLLKPYQRHYGSYGYTGITCARVYDHELIKRFKALGFDFSDAAVTAWLATFLAKQPLTPSLFELLVCLKECGVVFPEMVDGKSYDAFMSEQFRGAIAYRGEKVWIDALKDIKKEDLQAHYIHLGLSLNPEVVITPHEYNQQFKEKCLLLNKPRVDYDVLLVEWIGKLREGKVTIDNQTYDKIYGDFPLAVACLDAYIASANYTNATLQKGTGYFNFFFDVIKSKLSLFQAKAFEAIHHKSETKKSFVGKGLDKFSVFTRAFSASAVFDALKAQIDEIMIMSPSDHKDQQRIIEIYLEVNAAIEAEAKANTINSAVVNKCFTSYKNQTMFAGKEIDLSSCVGRESILDILPEEMQPMWTETLAKINKDQSRVSEDQATYQAPKKTAPQLEAQAQPSSPAPSAPPMDDESVLRAPAAYGNRM